MPRFDKIGRNTRLNPKESYSIPETPKGLRATHVGLKNGMIAFFWSPDGTEIHRSSRKWLFMRIPLNGVNFLAFPETKRTPNGWHYGIKPAARSHERVNS